MLQKSFNLKNNVETFDQDLKQTLNDIIKKQICYIFI